MHVVASQPCGRTTATTQALLAADMVRTQHGAVSGPSLLNVRAQQGFGWLMLVACFVSVCQAEPFISGDTLGS